MLPSPHPQSRLRLPNSLPTGPRSGGRLSFDRKWLHDGGEWIGGNGPIRYRRDNKSMIEIERAMEELTDYIRARGYDRPYRPPNREDIEQLLLRSGPGVMPSESSGPSGVVPADFTALGGDGVRDVRPAPAASEGAQLLETYLGDLGGAGTSPGGTDPLDLFVEDLARGTPCPHGRAASGADLIPPPEVLIAWSEASRHRADLAGARPSDQSSSHDAGELTHKHILSLPEAVGTTREAVMPMLRNPRVRGVTERSLEYMEHAAGNVGKAIDPDTGWGPKWLLQTLPKSVGRKIQRLPNFGPANPADEERR